MKARRFAVYTHDATNAEVPAQRLELTTPEALMITGYNQVLKAALRQRHGGPVHPGPPLFHGQPGLCGGRRT